MANSAFNARVNEPRPEQRRQTPFWHSFANMAQVAEEGEIVIVGGEGCEVVDREGRRYLDATASLWYCMVGFGRREIAEAVSRQMVELPAYSTFGAFANEPALELCQRIAERAPLPEGKVFLTSGGSDAIDTAAKMARRYWSAVGKPEKRVVIGRSNAYHGMHAYGTSLAGIPANVEGMGEIVRDVSQVDYDSVEALAAEIERLGPEKIAAFVGEPVIGAGGVLPPPEDYWPRVADLCRENDILLIADEVVTGWGRLGHWFGCERFGFEPDLLVFAKGVTSGYLPLGGVVAGPRVQEPFWTGEGTPFRHGYTYSGHAVACAAALANLEIIEDEGLVDRVAELEPVWRARIGQLEKHSLVGEVRSAGLLGAVELASEALEARPGLTEEIVAGARHKGVITRSLQARALQLSPAFTIEPRQIDGVVDGIWQALDEFKNSGSSGHPGVAEPSASTN